MKLQILTLVRVQDEKSKKHVCTIPLISVPFLLRSPQSSWFDYALQNYAREFTLECPKNVAKEHQAFICVHPVDVNVCQCK